MSDRFYNVFTNTPAKKRVEKETLPFYSLVIEYKEKCSRVTS